MHRRKTYNAKRRLCEPPPDRSDLASLARRVSYGGNPEHKRNPGDFGLTPPAYPRSDKSLCDDVGIFQRQVALGLLREGISRGMFSVQRVNDFPQNIWAVTDDGQALEAQLENQVQGIYHGYPMPEADPLRALILEQWAQRDRAGEHDG